MNLKSKSISELIILCKQLRRFIIDVVAKHGGHLGASLGVTELTVAIHRTFDLPKDKLIWDVGHQAYIHKILTGRKDIFYTNRKWGGISGFPSRKESPYDDFGTGHSSTSLSAILGMAVAARHHQDYQARDRWHVAVIGDGAFTAGMPFEALNNLSIINQNNLKSKVLILLNDNGMSIDKNVGTLKEHFSELGQYDWKEYSEWKESANTIFDFFGANFRGSIDGHNLEELLSLLSEMKQRKEGVYIIHVRTRKGKGILESYKNEDENILLKEKYDTLEQQFNNWHAPAKFAPQTGKVIPQNAPKVKKFQDVFGQTLLELARQNDKIVAITPAMTSGSSLLEMKKVFPSRVFDVGIAEQHAVTFSAGLAAEGVLPFCVVYSTFLQRSYDQIIHDVCVQNLKVIFCIDRAGLVGADGATHQGVYDIAYLRPIPNLVVSAPMDEIELQHLLYTAQLAENKSAMAIRYPRGEGFREKITTDFEKIEIGKGRQIEEGSQENGIAVLSYGIVGNFVQEANRKLEAKAGKKVGHFDMRFAKPLDSELLHQICKKYQTLITIEDGSKIGGFGSAISEWFHKEAYQNKLIQLGVEDEIIPHGTQAQQYEYTQISAESILNKIEKLLSKSLE